MARAASSPRPLAIPRQNHRSPSRRCDGLPGDFIAERPVNSFIHPAGLPIATPHIEVLRRPHESAQYTSYDFTQALDDHDVLASIGTVGDAFDNALAESFVDSFKTELIADRVWRTQTQLELAVVEYVGWFNHDRLHEALGDRPPTEFEQLHQAAISGNGSVAGLSPKPADRLYAPRSKRERASGTQTALSAITDPRPASPASLS